MRRDPDEKTMPLFDAKLPRITKRRVRDIPDRKKLSLGGYMPFVINPDGEHIELVNVKTGSMALAFESERKAQIALDEYLRSNPAKTGGMVSRVIISIDIQGPT